MTPIDDGVEIRDFIAALETAPEVMAAAVGTIVLGLVVVLLLLSLTAVTSGGVVILPFLLFGPPRLFIVVVTTDGAP